MEKLLTISIAAYNMETYLPQCLDSLIVPEFMDEMEILIVDDGSTDGTLGIAQSYAERYPDTFIPVKKENGGFGSTVNYSVAHAKGKYFKLLDADDWYDRNGFLLLLEALRRTNTDVVVTTKFCTGSDPSAMEVHSLNGWDGEGQVKVKDIAIDDVFNSCHLTFKTDILRQCGLNLPHHMLYTDNYYLTVPFAEAKDLLYLDCMLYCYRHGRDGQSTSRGIRIMHTRDHIKVTLDLLAFCEKKLQEGNENIGYIIRRLNVLYMNVIRTILVNPVCKETQKELIEFESRAREICPSVYEQTRKMHKKTAFLLRLFEKTNYKAYWLLKLIPGGMPNKQ